MCILSKMTLIWYIIFITAAAKQRAPSVIFIDEIDSVGAKRTSSQIHPYANQTVNQLLSEMDGYVTIA